jgi:cytochrome b6-f complex iron-sulfur subunit
MEDNKTTRRRALNILLGLGGAAAAGSVLYPALAFLLPPRKAESTQFAVTLDFKASEMDPGTGRIFRFGNRPGLIICEAVGGEKKFLAYSAICTHLGCVVEYQPDSRTIFCPCHNGRFDINGNNISGPPPRPLDKFKVQVSGDTITVVREG